MGSPGYGAHMHVSAIMPFISIIFTLLTFEETRISTYVDVLVFQVQKQHRSILFVIFLFIKKLSYHIHFR